MQKVPNAICADLGQNLYKTLNIYYATIVVLCYSLVALSFMCSQSFRRTGIKSNQREREFKCHFTKYSTTMIEVIYVLVCVMIYML